MELATIESPANTKLVGDDTISIPAGQYLRIETSPGGAEILDVQVPAGKVWNATIGVNIDEASV